jgi:Concanavalin A-like lectin/glucanases superfamily/Galactose oxidase-like, Early set domain/Bacterial Ig domain
VLVAPGATTHANDMHQRLVPLTMTPATGGLTLTAPAAAAIAPPGYYMLFLLNTQGIPSVAKLVRLTTGPPPPPDTTPPTVSVSAPAAGATVSGTTPVNATAADNVAVAGVQFTLDGANLGAEDTSAPYSVSWNTTTATNGAHALRAIARDSSTNATTSDPVSVSVSNAAPPPPTGLVAAYGFEETSGTAVSDSSPAANPGTISGAAARTAAGKIGRAIDFDGVNDYVSVADANSLDLSTGMTLEAWVQLDTVSSWRTTILKEKPGGLVYALYANSSSARPQGEIVTGAGAGTDRLAGIGPALTAGTWTHLALTYDNAQLRLYKNGVQVVQAASTGAIQASANPLRIGGNAIWGEYTDGRIDEVRVYNRALSAAEITSDMTTPVV